MSTAPTLVYWKLKARGHMAQCMLAAGNVEYTYDDATANAWPGVEGSTKANAPFGQMPYMIHDGVVIAQSTTIARYAARLAGLMPESPAEIAKVEMIMDHLADVFASMAKAQHSPADDKAAQWEACESKVLPKQLAFLVPLLNGKKYYGGDKVNAADVAVYSCLDVIQCAGCGRAVEGYPELLAVMAGVKGTGKVAEMEVFGPYLKK